MPLARENEIFRMEIFKNVLRTTVLLRYFVCDKFYVVVEYHNLYM